MVLFLLVLDLLPLNKSALFFLSSLAIFFTFPSAMDQLCTVSNGPALYRQLWTSSGPSAMDQLCTVSCGSALHRQLWASSVPSAMDQLCTVSYGPALYRQLWTSSVPSGVVSHLKSSLLLQGRLLFFCFFFSTLPAVCICETYSSSQASQNMVS